MTVGTAGTAREGEGAVHRRAMTLALITLAAALLVALGRPAVGVADCGGTVTAHPAHHAAGQAPPLALGDSTMLLSLPGLAAGGYEADAHGCRQLVQALPILAELRARHSLPHMVTIALGSNCCVSSTQIDQALSILGPTRLLVLVTPVHAPAADAIEHDAARRYPSRIMLLDWVAASAGHGSWFQPDGLHLTSPGVSAFTSLLARALPYAYQPCPPGARAHRRRAHRSATARAHRRRAHARAAGSTSLGLTAGDSRTGYVSVRLTGPPGTVVALGERRAGAMVPLASVTIPASGTLSVARLMTWLCVPRRRTVVATAPGAASVTATITTPSCAGRLTARVASRGRVGSSLTLHVRDRWRIGDARLRICLAPPGGGARCRRGSLAPGQGADAIRVPLPRPGRWTVTLRTGYGRPVVRHIWASHPGGRIRLLAAGDSEMQILDGMIAQDLRGHGVGVTSDARISSGLTNSFFFDWQREARRKAVAVRPDVSVVFIGANDGFNVAGPGGRRVSCCGPAWSAGYASLVAEMASSLLRGDAGRVYWFLLPTPRPANFQSLFDGVNRGIRLAARRFPGRIGLIDANAFFTPGNRYRDHMVYRNHGFVIHESDGIHLSAASDEIAAQLLVERLRADHVIR